MKSVAHPFLAIAPATKRFGAAVFKDTELIYFAVKTLKPPRITESIKAEVSGSIEHLIREFAPKVIVIKSPGKLQLKSVQFKLITDQIGLAAKFNQIPVSKISFEPVKKFFCFNRKSSKDNTFASLTTVYPELRQFTGSPGSWRKQYYDILLIATALGHYYQTELIETQSRT